MNKVCGKLFRYNALETIQKNNSELSKEYDIQNALRNVMNLFPKCSFKVVFKTARFDDKSERSAFGKIILFSKTQSDALLNRSAVKLAYTTFKESIFLKSQIPHHALIQHVELENFLVQCALPSS